MQAVYGSNRCIVIVQSTLFRDVHDSRFKPKAAAPS